MSLPCRLFARLLLIYIVMLPAFCYVPIELYAEDQSIKVSFLKSNRDSAEDQDEVIITEMNPRQIAKGQELSAPLYDKKKCMIDLTSLFLDFLTLIVIIISVWLLYQQISKQHEWNRRKAAQDLTSKVTEGELGSLAKKLDQYAEWNNPEHNYTVAKTDDNKEELDHALKVYLNNLEGIALGIKHHIYDEDIAYEYWGAIFTGVSRWAMPYIENSRSEARDNTLFVELTSIAKKWEERDKTIKEKFEKSLTGEGKERL